jgi:AraC-like DNA-binding protein
VNADLVPVPSQVLERLAAIGVDVARVLQHARLSRSQLAARAHLTTREFFAFWRVVEQVSGRRDLGLRLGSEASPHQLDVASLAALHAPNLGEALKKLARYKRLVCPEEIEMAIVDGEARIRFHWILADEQIPLLIVDGAFATVMAIAHRGTGRRIVPRRVELTRRRADEQTLTRHFGCDIHFDAALDLLVLEERALAEPFLTHNEDLLAVMLPGLEAAVAEHGPTRTIGDDVRMILGRRMHGERPTVEKIADEMRMSPRTLQRRLEAVGTTYQELLDEVRRQSARRLLSNTDLDAGEVAFLLGFEELNSFTRAFHTWEGTTPTRWRASDNSQG